MRARLIVMVKYPEPGAVKTRLIPALGARRACDVHCALVRHTLVEVKLFAELSGTAVEVCTAGAPDDESARAWLGDRWTLRAQGGGDLGARLERAMAVAFTEGAGAVVVIGTDCPQLTTDHLVAAFAAMKTTDVVLGPATDGGYYLIGARRPAPALFHNIAWGTAAVLAQTLAAAQVSRLTHQLLPPLADVDFPADLPHWAQTAGAREPGLRGVSVIIPTLNEAAHLSATLAAVTRDAPHEVIVIDGGSTDGTPQIARKMDATFLTAPRGRAPQMNFGASVATGEHLLFLHADTLPPAGYPTLIRAALERPDITAGAFQFALDGEFSGRALIEVVTNWRARWMQMPYGDQGLFVRREVFERLGGFPVQALLEDYELVRRLRRRGRITILPVPARTSPRRWQRLGAVRTTLLNQAILLGYKLGISPARLFNWYQLSGESATPAPSLNVTPVRP